MTQVYTALFTYQQDDWEDYLERLTVFDIFKDLLNEYTDKDIFKSVIRYILATYSLESEMIITSTDWKTNKKKIFEGICVQPVVNLYEDLVLLKNATVRETIHRWMEWQDNDTYTQLQVLKDLKVEMQMSCLSDIRTPSNEINYSQKFNNAKYVGELSAMIKALESELMQNDSKFKEAVKEIKPKSKQTMGVEHFAY